MVLTTHRVVTTTCLAVGLVLLATLPASAQTDKNEKDATPTRRLLDKLKEQNADQGVRFNDPWAKTIRELIELGPDAVPELIAELDVTEDNMMLRCLGFSLRAIGDKRAVPALIRALPRTLLPSGSDMGCLSHDAELLAFMQKHDLDDGGISPHYGFGRPFREVVGALRKLTGHQFDEMQLNWVGLRKSKHQQQIQRRLFARVAKKWADWWEANWKDHVQDEAYSKVGLVVPELPLVKPLLEGRFETVDAWSGATVESVLDVNAGQIFYDLDTGYAAPLPEKWRDEATVVAKAEEIIQWAANEGFDIMGTEVASADGEGRHYAIRSIGMQAWELSDEHWKLNSKGLELESLKAVGRPADAVLVRREAGSDKSQPTQRVPYFYITREGTPGLLFVGVEVKDTNVAIGAIASGDQELNPVGFHLGRKFGYSDLVPVDVE